MEIFLHNTMSGKKETFEPLQAGNVTMYNCGPTVYNYAHIGNLRSYVFADFLRRMFEWNGYTVNQVMNITDVGHLTSDADLGEDKVEKEARKEGKTAKEVTEFYTAAFFQDLDEINIDRANITFPRATENIPEQINLILKLESGGFTYKTTDGIYFDTSKFSDYGKLGNIDLKGLREGARVEENAEKKNLTDFALWKFSPVGEKRQQEWQSPWGVGFPGWHIECSAMSVKYLGPEFDIHTGGIDHIPVHHNNEIAQSVCAGYPYAHYWMHNAFLNIGADKMAKSGENFITLATVKEKGINPLALRYFYLTARYSTQLDFSWDSLTASETALKRLKKTVNSQQLVVNSTDESRVEYYKNTFTEYINDDLDTPNALALVWELTKDTNVSNADKKKLILDFDAFFGLKLSESEVIEIPEEVKGLISDRDKARSEKDFSLSDSLRTQIESLGFKVLDTDSGTKVEKA